jgi:hypothetical protein
MIAPVPKDSLRIFTPTGMLGYGYDHSVFWATVVEGVDAIICDSGSTDSGPSKLALGTMSCPRAAYYHDLEPCVLAAHAFNIPLLVGSAGGDGSNDHVDAFVDIIQEIIQKRNLRSMKVLTIYSEIDKNLIKEEMAQNRIVPCGSSVPALKEGDIDDASRVVAQMGLEPFLKAMEENPGFDIIIGGRAYDPSPYAAFCLYKGFNDLGIAYHMGKILECGAICAIPKSREALAIVYHDCFDITTRNPKARCTAVSVAAHTLYEKTRPDMLVGPGGTLYLQDTTYEELNDQKTVRVRGAKFLAVEEGSYTVKLEAAKIAGFHSTFFGGFADPVLISQIKDFLDGVRAHVSQVCKFPYDLKLTTYGGLVDKISMFPETRHTESGLVNSATMGIIGEAMADTQELATRVINAARVACMHASYQGQVATAGNFAMACAPFDIPMGSVCEFCIYHLMTVKDPLSLFPIKVTVLLGIDGGSDEQLDDATRGVMRAAEISKATSGSAVTHASKNAPQKPRRTLDAGKYQLRNLASVIRSKNAGPYELTFDVMFDSPEIYNKIKDSQALSGLVIERLYGLSSEDIVAALWWDPAMAFKATVKRPVVSGGFGETDTHGSCQHVRLMELEVEI